MVSSLKRIFQSLVLLIGIMLMPLAQATGQDTPERQSQFMAIYLMHFANFIEWPDSAQPDKTQFNICFYADERLSGYIKELRGETINNGTINVVEAPEQQQLTECQIVFIEHSQIERFTEIKTQTQQSAILFVSDKTGFIDQGGTMEYFVANNKLRFAVNMKAAKEKELILSSKLLMIAKIIE